MLLSPARRSAVGGPVRRWRVSHRYVPAGNRGNGGVVRRSTSSLAEIFEQEDWIRVSKSARLERLHVYVRDGGRRRQVSGLAAWTRTISLETWACTVESRHETQQARDTRQRERYVGRAGCGVATPRVDPTNLRSVSGIQRLPDAPFCHGRT